ncbi:MAG TPA: calcium/sodium antiporter [Tepidisphaeraceae bacterium]|nr:calcium/sodium antiporter [Tepidisphaeraceae bacterium]
MLIAILEVVAGLGLLLLGAQLLVDGASALARRAGVPPLVVGLTVVAFGTSTPEVVVNVMATVNGETGLTFGNVVGACAVNVGCVLALTALICPLAVEKSIITREIPMLLLGVTGMVVMSLDSLLSGIAPDMLSRADGIILLLLFGVFLYYTISGAVRPKPLAPMDPFIAELKEEVADAEPQRSLARDVLITVLGFIGVGGGGRVTVIGATSIAERLGVPEVVVGLTIVSFGTTLPELATCIVAARRGHSDVALGNIVGSNIYNLLFIGGLCATIRPLPIPLGGHIDLLMTAALCAALLPLSLTFRHHITRFDGALLMAGYLAYIIWRSIGAALGA